MSKVSEYLKEKEIEIERENDINNLRKIAVRVTLFSVSQNRIFENAFAEAEKSVDNYRKIATPADNVSAANESDDPDDYEFADKEKKA